MALAQNPLLAGVWSRLRTRVGVRFTRFIGVAAASLGATEVALTVCHGLLPLTPGPATAVSWLAGAVVSYVLSRWAWERKGRPDVLRETIPFWVISAVVFVVLYLATKFGYKSAVWMGLTGVKNVLWVDFVWLVANFVTFVTRFVIFHYVLFTDRATAARAAATGPDTVPPGTRHALSAGEAPHSAVPGATAEAGSAGGGPGGAAADPATSGGGVRATRSRAPRA